MPRPLRRREVIGLGVGGVVAVALGAQFWDDLFGSAQSGPPRPGGGYGPRGAPDANGLRLPRGYESRLIARGGEPVAGTSYDWHAASDGAAVFGADDGGWVMVSNSEVDDGGVSAIRFDADGQITDAYRVLEGTSRNCSGGGTPWGTWLSCEEVEEGRVWECDPAGGRPGVVRPAMGVFTHEAAAVDPQGRRVYLTEDVADGGLYRFTPERWEDLSAGLLEIARVGRGGAVEWLEVPDPAARTEPTRHQVDGAAAFKRGEGLWFDAPVLYVATTEDHTVHAYDTRRGRIDIVYQASKRAPLLKVDQMTGTSAGEVFVCEGGADGEFDLGLIAPGGRVSKFLSATGPQHRGSEFTGVCFDPSGSRLYIASQRAHPDGDEAGAGAIYEIAGPFKGAAA